MSRPLNSPGPMTDVSRMQMILVVSGPAGCGKTTVAEYLAQTLAIPYLEGDDYHTKTNKAKMSSGTPLTDSDRWDWLITLRQAALRQLHSSGAVVVTCSSLRRKYRDVFRVVSYNDPAVCVNFIYLKVDEVHLQARVKARKDHYMKEEMVRSQIETLEEPTEDEFDVIKVDVQQDQATVCQDVLAEVRVKVDQCKAPRNKQLILW